MRRENEPADDVAHDPDAITREEYYGKPGETKRWLLGTTAYVLLLMIGVKRFAFLDGADPAWGRVALWSYFIGIAYVIARRKALFPWARKLPGLAVASWFLTPLLAVFVGGLAYMYANALLDRSPPERRLYLVREHPPGIYYGLPVPEGEPFADSMPIGLGVRAPESGRTLEIEVGRGFFGTAWIKSWRLFE